jgi:hypothetical protein
MQIGLMGIKIQLKWVKWTGAVAGIRSDGKQLRGNRGEELHDFSLLSPQTGHARRCVGETIFAEMANPFTAKQLLGDSF